MLRTRVLTALVLGPVVLAIAWFREPWLSLGVLLIVGLGLWEATDLLRGSQFAAPRHRVVGGLLWRAPSCSRSGASRSGPGSSLVNTWPFGLPVAVMALVVIGWPWPPSATPTPEWD
jgi:CDP-diglyceride synthetase